MRIPESSTPFHGFGQAPLQPQINLTVLEPSEGSIVTASASWWTFGLGQKTFPTVIRITNNTSAASVDIDLRLYMTTPAGNPTGKEFHELKTGYYLGSGETYDFPFDLPVPSDFGGSVPVLLSVSAIGGSGSHQFQNDNVHFTLNVP